MSDGAGRWWSWALISWAVLASGLEGQVPSASNYLLSPDERARLEADLADVEARLAEVQALEFEMREAATLRPGNVGPDHVRRDVGPVEIRGPRHLLPAAAGAATHALGQFRGLSDADGALTALRIDIHDAGEVESLAPPYAGGSGTAVLVATAEDVRALVDHAVRRHVLEAIPQPLVPWSGGWGWDSAFRPDDGVRLMVQSTNRDGIACLQRRDLEACAGYLALSYDGSTESKLALLEYHYPASAFLPPTPVSETPRTDDLLGRCVFEQRRRGTPDARGTCLADLASREYATLGLLPSHPSARASLVAHALQLGGDGALTRLMRRPDGGSVGAHLAVVAGTSEAELVRSWQEDVSGRTGVFRSEGGERPGPASLFWAGGLALLALRSTRWRLG